MYDSFIPLGDQKVGDEVRYMKQLSGAFHAARELLPALTVVVLDGQQDVLGQPPSQPYYRDDLVMGHAKELALYTHPGL